VFDPEELVGTPRYARCGVREWPFTVAYRSADGAARRPYHGSNDEDVGPILFFVGMMQSECVGLPVRRLRGSGWQAKAVRPYPASQVSFANSLWKTIVSIQLKLV